MIERLRRTRRQLAAGLVAVAVLAPLALAAAQWPSYWRWIAAEQTPMTWLQSVVLVLAAATCLLVTVPLGLRGAGRRDRLPWLVLACGFAALALDERFAAHERVRDGILAPRDVQLPFLPWVAPGDFLILLLALGGSAVLPVVLRMLSPDRTARRLFLTGAALAVVAVAIDSIDPSTWSLTAERLQQSLEEVGELAAGLCLLGAVVLRLLRAAHSHHPARPGTDTPAALAVQPERLGLAERRRGLPGPVMGSRRGTVAGSHEGVATGHRYGPDVLRPGPARLCLLLALGTACSSPAPAAGPAGGSPGAPSAGDPASDLPTSSPVPDGPLTLAFAGDVHFARQLAPLLDDPATGLAELRPHLAGADLTMVNLETALTSRGAEAPKPYHFRSPPTALDALAGAGVDVVTMANNHAVDYGPEGLLDTLAARNASPVPVVGLGRDDTDAYAPAVLQARGRRVAVLGATQVPDWTARTHPARQAVPGVAVSTDPARLARAVRETRASADVVVVYLHWGTDYTACPDPAQKRTAQALAAAGADVVVGGHAHRVQGGGWLGPTYVAYGLGNFVWYSRNSPQETSSGVLTLTLDGRHVVGESWLPLEVSADGIPRPPAPPRAETITTDRERARGCAGLAASPP